MSNTLRPSVAQQASSFATASAVSQTRSAPSHQPLHWNAVFQHGVGLAASALPQAFPVSVSPALSVHAKLHGSLGLQGACASGTSLIPPSVDTYHEEECDVGPRAFGTLVSPSQSVQAVVPPLDRTVRQLYVDYNAALVLHANHESTQALALYNSVTSVIHHILSVSAPTASAGGMPSVVARTTFDLPYGDVYHLAMMAYNNIGQIYYVERSEDEAVQQFEHALAFARLLVATVHPLPSVQLDCVAVMSNWCRTQWITDNIDDELHSSLREILRVRSALLGWDHADVAAAHYNLGLVDYARRSGASALGHFSQYLKISSHRVKTYRDTQLDPVPAVIHTLLIQKEHSNDGGSSQEIIKGLKSLHEKRQDLSPMHPDIASVLNYVGTMLFHQKDLEHALLFFQEELHLEETIAADNDEVSISVTCNNIGRILQELGRFPDAIYYYQRSLCHEFGDVPVHNEALRPSTDVKASVGSVAAVNSNINGGGSGGMDIDTPASTTTTATDSAASFPVQAIAAATDIQKLTPATMNLYSTVWYNLGLIHDKMGAYKDAIGSFQMSLFLRRSMLGHDHADVACLLYNIGVLQMEQQMLDDATASFREALRIRRVASTGQLNDRHVIKTLQKLSSLHKSKGNVKGALEASREVLSLLEMSTELDARTRAVDMATTMREIADLHHAQGELEEALRMATDSVELLRSVCSSGATFEQETAGLLLVGSLQHELCDASLAQQVFSQAVQAIRQQLPCQPRCPRLLPLLEISSLLAQRHCAAMA